MLYEYVTYGRVRVGCMRGGADVCFAVRGSVQLSSSFLSAARRYNLTPEITLLIEYR